jgi:hypothetical protein
MSENNLGMDTVLLQQLNTIQTSVQDLGRKQDILSVKLFGEEGSENSQGRLPRLEQTADTQNGRIKRLEDNWIKISVYLAIGNVVLVGILTALFNHLWSK